MYPRYSATIRFSIISTTHPPRIRARASGQRGQHRPPGHPEDVCSGQFVRIHDALPARESEQRFRQSAKCRGCSGRFGPAEPPLVRK